MKKQSIQYLVQVKLYAVFAVIISVVVFMSFTLNQASSLPEDHHVSIRKDSIESVTAFMEVYKVLKSPRCMNCHPSGDIPLQGDNSQPHSMLPKRGKDGRGIGAMKCSTCHLDENQEGLNMPPGNPDWRLPPAYMKMVFQGMSPNQLAKQLVDSKINGNKTLQKLIEHADDGLVKAGWNPGEGRTIPPISYDAFKKAWITWIEKGAYAPKE
jgi:hypothetical protein